ncbi:MAG: hypothetical protein MHM6MM_005085 [Cercozoa sp. M6MM]
MSSLQLHRKKKAAALSYWISFVTKGSYSLWRCVRNALSRRKKGALSDVLFQKLSSLHDIDTEKESNDKEVLLALFESMDVMAHNPVRFWVQTLLQTAKFAFTTKQKHTWARRFATLCAWRAERDLSSISHALRSLTGYSAAEIVLLVHKDDGALKRALLAENLEDNSVYTSAAESVSTGTISTGAMGEDSDSAFCTTSVSGTTADEATESSNRVKVTVTMMSR